MGGSIPQSTGVLVCPKCEDALDDQARLLILPPDPQPWRNTRPYPYEIDESFTPVQELATVLILNLNINVTLNTSTNVGTPGAWLFDLEEQSGEILTAGLS
jgi:hypothetical protein